MPPSRHEASSNPAYLAPTNSDRIHAMPAYIIAHVEITDPERYREYMALTPGAIAAQGGRFLVRGGNPEALEGKLERSRVVVIEFPDRAAARAFYDSELYRTARAKRAGAAEFTMILVDGV